MRHFLLCLGKLFGRNNSSSTDQGRNFCGFGRLDEHLVKHSLCWLCEQNFLEGADGAIIWDVLFVLQVSVARACLITRRRWQSNISEAQIISVLF